MNKNAQGREKECRRPEEVSESCNEMKKFLSIEFSEQNMFAD